ncbi:MAG: HEAT repeat domain-containing protein [Deltaproteobacteria bacterium]|nr:HEAT repeat domain-containing protein [Deltaproteobacteria bacterium]
MSTTIGEAQDPAGSFYKDELERDQIAALLRARALTANEVVEGLWHGQVVVRINAARGVSVLAELPDPGEVMLRISAKDVDVRVRTEIIGAVATGKGGTAVAVPILFDALLDRGEGIRDTALQGLERRITAKPAEVVPYFVSAMGDPRALVATVATRLLVQAGGSPAIDHLVPRLGDADPRMRRGAFDVLDKLKWQAVGALIEALRDQAARPLVVKLLSGLGEVEPRHVHALGALEANARSRGDELLLDAVVKVKAEIARVVEPPRTAPLDIPIEGFFQRALTAAERGADAAGRAPLDELLYALKDGRALVRQNAVGLLAAHPDAGDRAKAVLSKLAPVVRDGDANVRVAAAATVGALGAGTTSAPRLLVSALGDPHPDVRQAAADALVGLGAEALTAAFDVVQAATPAVARRGLEAIAVRLGRPAVPMLADVLVGGAGTSPMARETAADSLAALGKQAEDGIAALLGALLDSMEDVRAAAAQALGFVGVNDEAILQALQRALKDTVPHVRRQAALAASRITGKPLDDRGAADPAPPPIPGFEDGVLDRAAIEAHAGAFTLEQVIRALRDGREVVRRNAATAIGTFGESGGPAAAPMSVLLRDADGEVRRAAVEAFLALGKAALPAAWFLTAAVDDPDTRVKDGVIDVLVALHPEDGDFLIEALRNDTEIARAGIFNVFYRLGRAGIADLGRALNNASGLIRLNGCWALEMMARRGADEVQEDIEARLSDPIGQVRVAAQAALDAVQGGRPRPPRVLEPEPVPIPGFDAGPLSEDDIAAHLSEVSAERMVRALRDGRPYVRQNAVTALGLFGADGLACVGNVAVAARDSGIDVRAAAASALTRLAAIDPSSDDGRRALALLVAALDDKQDKVKTFARAGLGQLGAAALPALVDALARPADAVKHTVLPVFAALGAQAVPALRAALDADSPLLRAGALRALRVVGREHITTLRDEIVRLDQSSDDAVRAEARVTVDHIDGKDVAPAAAPPLPIPPEMTAVELPAEVVKKVCEGLGVDLLLKATQDGREVVQANAARALGFVEDPPKRVAGGLAILLRSGDVMVRRAAVEALEALGPRHAAPAAFWLAVSLDEPDPAVKDRMMSVLAALHEELPDALIDALRVDPEVAPATIIPVYDRIGRVAIPTLGRALKSSSGLVRINAAMTLEVMAKKGAEEVVELLEVVAERDPIKQAKVAAALAIDAIKGGKPKPPRVLEVDPIDIDDFTVRLLADDVIADAVAAERTNVDRMVRALRDGRPFVRANAALALGAFGQAALDGGALTPLLVAARDSAIDVRNASVRALGKLRSDDAIVAIVAALEDRSDAVRATARDALVTLGTAALPAMIEALARPAVVTDKTVMPLFAKLAGDAVEALRGALASDSPLVRAGVLRALRVVGRDHAKALRADVQALATDSDDQIRAEVTATIDHIDGKDVAPPAAPPLPIPDAMVEGALGEDALRGVAAEVPVDVLVKALQDGREVVRISAARALGYVHAPPKRVAPALAILLRDADQKVREAAVEGLELLGPEAAAPAAFWLAVALGEPDPALKDRVINVMASLHRADEGPAALIEALRVDPEAAPTTIIPVFQRIGGSAIPTVVRALKAPSGLIRINAAMTLEAMAREGADQAWDDLEAALADPIKQVRTQAALAMDAIKGGKPRPPRVLEVDPVGIPELEDKQLEPAFIEANLGLVTGGVERLKRALADGRPWVRTNAAVALGAMGPDAHEAFARLAVCAKDEANEVRRAALAALGRVVTADRAGPILVQALADRSTMVRKAARDALAAHGEAAFPALALGLSTSSEVALEESLIPLLHGFGDKAIQAMGDALAPNMGELHAGALRVLLAFDKERIAPLRDAVDKVKDLGDPRVRALATTTLDKIDGRLDAPSALEPVPLPLPDFADGPRSRDQLLGRAEELRLDLLVHALHDGRDVVRENAAVGLGVLQTASEAIAPHLQLALKDPAEPVRFAAAQALANLKPRRDVAFDLVVALDDASPRVVKQAEEGLRRYGQFAIDAFMYGLDDEPELVGRSILPMLAAQGQAALDPLILALRYDSAHVRRNALIALQLMERPIALAARPAVSLLRRDESRDVRLEVRKTLDYLDDVPVAGDVAEPLPLPTPSFAEEALALDALREAVAGFDQALLARLMIDGRRRVRENAVRAHQALDLFHPHLPIRLKDDVADVQHAAAAVIEALGPKALPAVASMVEALGDRDLDIREPMHRALVALGAPALPAIIQGLWVPPDVARKTVVPILVELGEVATPSVIAALEHPSQLIQLNALHALMLLYAVDQKGAVKGMPRVIAMTRHVLPAIISAAQKCLFRLEGRTPAEFQKDPVPMPIPGFDKGSLPVDVIKPAAPGLDVAWMISALADGRDVVRENAARAAGYMPKAVKDLMPSLQLALRDAAHDVQIAAAEALATLGLEDGQAIPALTFALRDTQRPGGERVRRALLTALDAFGPKRCAAVLVEHLVGREDWMLLTIGRVAGRMHEVFVPALVQVALDGERSLIARENAVKILGDLGPRAKSATQSLLQLLPDMQGMLAAKAVFAISRVCPFDKAVIEAMQKRLQVDPRPSLHHEILQAVKILKRKQAVAPGMAA